MRTRSFGKIGIEVGVMGYGAMALSLKNRPAENEGQRILEQVMEAGVSFIDTADTYCLGPDELHHNERLIAKVVSPSTAAVLVATKGGTRRTSEGWEVDGTPEFLYRSICDSHAMLGGRSPIPVWQLHWPDPRYSIAEMLQPAQRAVHEGLIRFVGVCNFSVEQLKQARDMVPLVSVQNQFNLWHREAETDGVIEYCELHDLLFLPWRPLGGLGLSHRLGEIRPLTELARGRSVTPQCLMIAWHLAKSPCIVPIPGSVRLSHIMDCLAGQDLSLDPAEIRQLDAISAAALPGRDRPPAWEGMPPLAQGRMKE